jgi:hypothetical protein
MSSKSSWRLTDSLSHMQRESTKGHWSASCTLQPTATSGAISQDVVVLRIAGSVNGDMSLQSGLQLHAACALLASYTATPLCLYAAAA